MDGITTRASVSCPICDGKDVRFVRKDTVKKSIATVIQSLLPAKSKQVRTLCIIR